MGLFVLYLIGAHLRISFYAGSSLLVPMYPMLFSAAILTYLYRGELFAQAGPVFGLLFVFIMAQPIFSSAPGSGFSETILGRLQFLISVVSALAVIKALSHVQASRIRRLVLILWVCFIVLALLETIGLKPLFDAIRNVLYSASGRGIYESDSRDLALYGKIRTTVFASEPSFLADTLAAFYLLFFFLHPRRGSLGSWIALGAMFTISFVLSPSIKVVFYLLALIVWHFWPKDFKSFIRLLAFLALFGLVLLVLWQDLSLYVLNAVGGYSQSGSFFGRIRVAPDVGMAALRDFPLFGYGLGNDDGVYAVVAQAWQDAGAFILFPWYRELPASDLMSNGFWWQWIFLGWFGGAVFVVLMLRILGTLGVALPLRSLVCTWIIWYAGSAFVDPQSWFIVALFSIPATAHAVVRRLSEAETSEETDRDE